MRALAVFLAVVTLAVLVTFAFGHFSMHSSKVSTSLQQCTNCFSVREFTHTEEGLQISRREFHLPRKLNKEDVYFKTPIYSRCRHNWKEGLKYTKTRPILRSGQIVLVRNDNSYGAFIPKFTKISPNTYRCTYDWYYRTDGSGVFTGKRTTAGKCYFFGTASERGSGEISFGSFNVSLSIDKHGTAIITWPEQCGRNDVQICITALTDIKLINATENRWLYRSGPSDRGFRPGNEIHPIVHSSTPALNAKGKL